MFICEECGRERAFKIAETENQIQIRCPDCGESFWIDRATPEGVLDEARGNIKKLSTILRALSEEGYNDQTIEDFKLKFDETFGKDYPAPSCRCTLDIEGSGSWLDGFFDIIEDHLEKAAKEDGVI